VLAGQQQLAGQAPQQAAAQEALNNFALMSYQYQAPLSATPTYQPSGKVDQNVLLMIGSLLSGLDNHPINTQGPHPDSPVTNALADGQAKQYSGVQGFLQGVWNGTVGQAIHQAQQNPLSLIPMLGIGIGAIALTAVAPELAVPLWIGFGLLTAPHVLPQMFTSIADAAHNPTDSNVTQALINTAVAGLSIGLPFKAIKGVPAARGVLNEGMNLLQTRWSPQQAADDVLSISKLAAQPGERVKDVRDLVDPTAGIEQYDIVPQTVDELEREIQARAEGQAPIELDDATVERLRNVFHVHGQLQARVAEATPDMEAVDSGQTSLGDAVANALPDARRKVADFEKNDLIPAQKEFAHRYGYVLARENPLPRLTNEEIGAAGGRSQMDRSFRVIWGVLHGAGSGHGWDGVSDGTVYADFAANMAEAMARGQAAGGLEHGEAVMGTELFRAGRAAGIADDRMESIFRAVEGDATHENPEHYWDDLNPTERYFAHKMYTTFGIMTNYAYKHGHIELPLVRYVPRMLHREGVEYGRSGSSFLRHPGTPESRSWVGDDWAVTNDMTEEEFHPDEEQSLRPLADRLHQAVKTREMFQGQEDGRARQFQDTQDYRAILRAPGVSDRLAQLKQELGQLTKDWIPKSETKLEEHKTRIADLEKQTAHLDGQVREIDRRLMGIKGKHGVQFQRQTFKDSQQNLISQLRPATRELARRRTAHAELEQKLKDYRRRAETAGDRMVEAAGGDERARDLLHKSADELRQIAEGKHPGGRKLITGYNLPQVAFGRFLRQMNQTRYREAWHSIARTPSDGASGTYGANSPLSIQEINLMDPDQRPIAVPGDLPGGVPGAMLQDYVQVMPAIGRRGGEDAGSLNYHPPIYARSDVAAKYKDLAQRARSSSELQTAFTRAVYDVGVGIPKKFIMGSPAWHGKNVFGRYMTLLLDQPSIAPAALMRVLKERFLDPEKYYQTKMDHWMDGGVPSNRHNVHQQLNHLEQEMTGQRSFLTAMRTAAGAIGHVHAKLAEEWFWKTVDDIGTAAYLVQKHRMMQKPWMNERTAGMLAAEHSNNVAGMVNPLYMSKLWKYGRQMMMFAPNWWTSYARMAGQAVPGSARISHWLKDHPALSALDPVKMHSLDIRQRKELVRMHRSYFLTYMGAGMATHDLMNVILSGHHIWDNGKGREWDLQTDLSNKPKGDPETQGVKHAYLPGDLFFSQMADFMNAVGLGHDWGFLHQMQGDGYKQADALHKMGIVGGALGTGFQQRAAGKLGLPVQEAGALAGLDTYRLLRYRQAQPIPRTEALLSLLPAGSQAQNAIDTQRRLETRLRITGELSPENQAQLQQLQSGGQVGGVPLGPWAAGVKSQFMGMPSMYYMGDESPTANIISDAEMQKYLQSRVDILNRKKMLSQQLFDGGLSPFDWIKENEIQSNRYYQLLSDTFGPSSSQGQLWTAYDQLNKKYNLDNPNMSKAEQISAIQARQAEWQNQLNSFSPNAQAIWWDAHTSMWTDADYLYWTTQQTKDAIAGAIDGEGGAHIRARQHQLAGMGLPLSTKAQDELRKQDPYLWTYYAVLKQMGSNTLLGSLISAFANPYAAFNVIPDSEAEQVAALEEAGVLKKGTFVRRSSIQHLGQAARGLSQEAAPSGGRLAQTQSGQAIGRGLTSEEAAQILQTQQNLDPAIAQVLERIAGGG
jgi:hypothetical protein